MSDQSGPSAEEVLADRWGHSVGCEGCAAQIAALRAACGDPSGWVVIGPDGTLWRFLDELDESDEPGCEGDRLISVRPVEPLR